MSIPKSSYHALLTPEEIELKELQNYPYGARIATATAQTTIAIIIGASTIATFVTISAMLPLIIILALGIGAFAYAAKGIRDAYKRNQLEQQLVKKFNKRLENVRSIFEEKNDICRGTLAESIEEMLTLFQGLSTDEQNNAFHFQINKFRLHLYELQFVLNKIFPNPQEKTNWKIFINQAIEKIEQVNIEQISRQSDSSQSLISAKNPMKNGWWDIKNMPPQDSLRKILLARPKENQSSHPAWTMTKKAGNRALSFLGGASTAATVGLIVCYLAFGISNPVGWVLTGLVGASVLFGIGTVLVDYYATRKQEQKIVQLSDASDQLKNFKRGVNGIKQELQITLDTTKQIKQLVIQRNRARLEAEKLKKDISAQNKMELSYSYATNPALHFNQPHPNTQINTTDQNQIDQNENNQSAKLVGVNPNLY
ncbi:MAG: hypothetical protein ACD_29C00253G0002 [uncultured bacterium]|nr:MAG: hypothetical protein ACD_29C00253G0002 [uncultured bacterium]